MSGADHLIETIRWQQAGFRVLGAPFYARLADELMRDVERRGPVWRVLAPFADAAIEDAYVLRFLGGVHRCVLSGAAPALAAHFPSTDGDGDATAAATALADLLDDPAPMVMDAMSRPPQTNEVGRAAALASGLAAVADAVRLPLRLREIGASAGLNLRLDSYWYEQGPLRWGTGASPVRFVDVWEGGLPPFDAAPAIADRRGCDRDPIDVTTEDGALTALSYIWPEPKERFERARNAIAIARDVPAPVDRADAVDWLNRQLGPQDATALVVFHSIVWQYLGEETRSSLRSLIADAGARATPATPVAWLRLEPTPETYVPAELRLDLWDGSSVATERLLGTTTPHGGTVIWR